MNNRTLQSLFVDADCILQQPPKNALIAFILTEIRVTCNNNLLLSGTNQYVQTTSEKKSDLPRVIQLSRGPFTI